MTVTTVGISTSTFFPPCSTKFLNPIQEPRVSCFFFFPFISMIYQLLWCCSFVSSCYLKIRIQCKDTYCEDNALSYQYVCLHCIWKKINFLKNTPFLFHKNHEFECIISRFWFGCAQFKTGLTHMNKTHAFYETVSKNPEPCKNNVAKN